MNTCHCGSNLPYQTCCQPIIETQSAQTALQLMRSRYSAYCLGNVEYLRNTTVAANRNQFTEKDITRWLSQNRWIKLEIVAHHKGTEIDATGSVEFKAFFADASGCTQMHHEKSDFCKEDGRWLYLHGQVLPSVFASSAKPQRNNPCSCGSGKKYKNCCG